VEQQVQEFLSQKELAGRWQLSHRTLESWRWRYKGPAYIKLGGQVRYRLADIIEFERMCIRRAMANAQDIVRKVA
jgi:hypothetical protein